MCVFYSIEIFSILKNISLEIIIHNNFLKKSSDNTQRRANVEATVAVALEHGYLLVDNCALE